MTARKMRQMPLRFKETRPKKPNTTMVHVRVTESEKKHLQDQAVKETGGSIAEYVRRALFRAHK